MRLQTDNGEIILPDGFSFKIQQSHPFFSEDGSSSVPATLPATPDNMRVLHYPADINRASRYSRQLDSVLLSGSFFKRCRLVVQSGHVLDGIDMSLALDESEAYAEIQDKELRDILSDQFFTVSGLTPYQVYQSSQRRDCVFFPVAVDVSNGTVQQLNAVSNGDFVYAARTVTHGSGSVSVPDGYGLTCFLRLPELITKVFTLCGYTVSTNVFATDSRLSPLVLLNQCADALIESAFSTASWKVHYTDICPSITVGDLITLLRDKFGAVCLISDKVVDIRLFQDMCTAAADFDFSGYVRDDARPKLTYPTPKTLVLSMDTSIDGASPAAESLEALRASHANMVEVGSYSQISGNGLRLVTPLGKFYFRNQNWGTPTLLGSDAFPYRRTTEVTEEEQRKSADSFAAMIQASDIYMPYVGQSLRRNIDIDDMDKDADAKLMICNAIYSGGHWQGSQYGISDTGATVSGVHSLAPETLYTDYWQAYHAMIINGAPDITCTVIIPRELLLSMNLWTPKLIKGMKAFVKSVSYVLDDSPMVSAELTFASIPSYTNPVDIPGAIIFGTALGWQRYVEDNNSDYPFGYGSDYDVIGSDGLTDYTSSDAPSWTPGYIGQKAKSRARYYIIEETQNGIRTGRTMNLYYEEFFKAVYVNE